ncbi:MAG: hypothetical protein NT062_08725 [Proteobacteria bacterium]|nr:hypothetical protein [Pseudomonadota bacterium]
MPAIHCHAHVELAEVARPHVTASKLAIADRSSGWWSASRLDQARVDAHLVTVASTWRDIGDILSEGITTPRERLVAAMMLAAPATSRSGAC